LKRIPAIILLFSASLLRGQDNSYKYFYRVWFTDKGPESSITDPYELLSERAINRRIRAGIEFPDFRDFPVYRNYLNSIEERGLTLHCTSKWMNTALFKSPVALNTGLITGLPFVKEVRAVKYPAGKSSFADKLDFSADQYGFAPYDHPLGMINGNLLQNMGYDGKGILIAVNDGGFRYTDQVPSLEHLRQRNGIRAVRDFVSGDEFTYDHHTHGTAVLSILAGKLEGMLQGTATGADYMLFRTEDVSDEFPAEEDYWAAAAEYADSAGADIITSSLGYGLFDDPSLDYKFSDLDGNSAFITRAAAIAASKGILVFSSAGNERNKAWKKILAPSDGDSVISVAAVDRDRIISAFSSAGPSADGRIKPDLSAMGVNVPVQVSPGSVSGASGTSFSCPVLSGISACLLQAVPEAVASEIAGALRQSGDRYNSPDSLYGYGIPDMIRALDILQEIHLKRPENSIAIYPNPVTEDFEIIFREYPESVILEIFSFSGELIFRRDFNPSPGSYLKITALSNREQGIYFLRIRTANAVYIKKIIKLKS
jgi:hypothetical protein